MIELLTAVILHTQSPVYIEPQPKVAIQVGESESGRREREEQELKEKEAEKRARITVKARVVHTETFYNESYTSSSVEIIGESSEQCVEYYKRRSGVTRSLGFASNIPSQGSEPKIGAGALETSTGHISYVVAINGDSLILEDANWIKHHITRRTVPISSIRGYIYG